jgi:hypothetical protein
LRMMAAATPYLAIFGPQRRPMVYWSRAHFGPSADQAAYLSGGQIFPFLVQSELGVLLSEELAEKRQFPQGRRPELAAAYRAPEIAMLPNRQAQRRAISELEQFRQYRITDRLFREAERASGPRDSGSKRRQHD